MAFFWTVNDSGRVVIVDPSTEVVFGTNFSVAQAPEMFKDQDIVRLQSRMLNAEVVRAVNALGVA